ncbi:hypothetical protein [Glaciecola sp. KUL10]|uniref:hypothetical protein n=1 Tax=Glaciecola sp. (strain KUL10) TaxID=2161813 RepID=UPI000D99971A|nr:hypothetical protein [Glaciecola sp. KUL10]GBL05360.1 hypothetical protein KUL10_26800 [Glaciecola sp. KUL10]
MNNLVLPSLFALASLCLTGFVIAKTQSLSTIVMDATKDFPVIDAGDVPYYTDRKNSALGIDARRLEYRSLFAKAETTFNGANGVYDLTLAPMTEEDGEPLYRLLLNGKVVGTYRASYIGKTSQRDLTAETHTWQNIALSKNDIISIESNAHTNGEIPENDGTAWARGRWQSLTITPAAGKSQPPKAFSKHKDLLISQFDFQPDADDVHAVAALGSMLLHPDLKGVNRMAVNGTTGLQEGAYIDARELMSLAFGRENLHWVDAKKNPYDAVTLIRDRVKAVLAQGGNVWVQEAGQSDFTARWIDALLVSGVHPSVIKNNIIVVQHSEWNETKTSPDALAFVKDKAIYQAITDGNKPKKVYMRKNRRGPMTPMYVDEHSRWLAAATSELNSNEQARKLWQMAISTINKHGFEAEYSVIPSGGVDFSDNVAVWWILGLGQPASSVHAFWERYVTDVQLDRVNAPDGRLAVVIDGNSPDPDDIGATPVMFGLLQQAELSERLVHVSHSCDLDPFRNKGRQINAEDEARRQAVLHELSGKSIEFFGPFKNLRNYYNCRTDQDAARDDLVEAINASTASNPLWIIEAGEPDLIGFALEKASAKARKFVHVVSHHPANDDSGDYFEWQQILDFGVTEHQIGDQNLSLQTPISNWDWAKNHENSGYRFMWEMLAYAEQDGVVPFQANKFDCSDAGMVYWWITGADNGGNNFANTSDIKDMLLQEMSK